MKRYKFNSNNDVYDFLNELLNDGFVFHLDDDPETIEWDDETTPMEHELYMIKLNHIDMWNFCNPWEVLEQNPDLSDLYIHGGLKQPKESDTDLLYNELLDANCDDAINLAFGHIQKQLGVTSGDYCSHWLTDEREAILKAIFKQYINDELQYGKDN